MHKDDLKSNLQEKELSEIDFKEKNIPRQKILVHYFLSIADKQWSTIMQKHADSGSALEFK